MNRLFCVIAVMVVLGLAACSGNKDKEKGEEFVANSTPAEKQQAGDVIAQGEALVKGSDCNTCHHKVNNLIGPAHTEVAKKYEFTEANVKMLAEKIMKGGAGNWGQVPMAAHSDLKQEDAEAMARYVLSLDGEKEH